MLSEPASDRIELDIFENIWLWLRGGLSGRLQGARPSLTHYVQPEPARPVKGTWERGRL